ncbi:hypothetical protein BGZ52_000521 [Haplosporangium bisporale]|nr:hypothetical protein BGZ52_000521 [Haplosporangium bisporale]
MATTSQYYRVKRHTQTIFINSANPNSEKVLDLKHKIVKALASTKNPDPVAAAVSAPADIQLSVLPAKSSPGSASSPAGGQYTPLVDSKTLQASGLVDQQVIAMTLKTRGMHLQPARFVIYC